MEESSPCIKLRIQQYSLYNLIRSPACFKRVQGKCIDLPLTNRKHSFFGCHTLETGLSDFHHMIYTILKTTVNRGPPMAITYRDYCKFSETSFLTDLSNAMSRKFPTMYHNFQCLIEYVLEEHAPTKKATIKEIVKDMSGRI